MPVRPNSPPPALANLGIAWLLLALAGLVLVILNRISTYSELISTCLGVCRTQAIVVSYNLFLQSIALNPTDC